MRDDTLRPEHLTKKYFEPTKTLRDEFAIAALQGLLANPDLTGFTVEDAVDDAYDYADLMLRAREARA